MRATSSPFFDLFDSVDVKLPREGKLIFHAAFLFASHFNCSPSFYEGNYPTWLHLINGSLQCQFNTF